MSDMERILCLCPLLLALEEPQITLLSDALGQEIAPSGIPAPSQFLRPYGLTVPPRTAGCGGGVRNVGEWVGGWLSHSQEMAIVLSFY